MSSAHRVALGLVRMSRPDQLLLVGVTYTLGTVIAVAWGTPIDTEGYLAGLGEGVVQVQPEGDLRGIGIEGVFQRLPVEARQRVPVVGRLGALPQDDRPEVVRGRRE